MNKRKIRAALRNYVFRRAQERCEYCGSPAEFNPDPLSIEHIIPRMLKGGDELDNLALSCQGCNGIKFTKTTAIDSITGEVVPLYHPRQDNWSEHFQ